MVRTTLGAEVETNVSVSGSESVTFLEFDQTETVPANTTENATIRAPQGSILELLSLDLFIPNHGTASDGDHRFDLRSESQAIPVLSIVSDAGVNIQYSFSTVNTGNIAQTPSTDVAQGEAVRGIRADENNGFQFNYRNRSSVDQTSRRRYSLWVRQIQVVD